MGWIGNIIENIKGENAIDFVLTRSLKVGTEQAVSEPLTSDDCYVELFIEALWLPKSRRLSSTMYGVVHSFVSLQRVGEGRAEVAFVSSPSELARVDAKSLHKIVTRTQRALGPVPWRGQDLDLQIGLFSVKVSDLTAPFLDLITSISTTAGVSYVAAAAPFVPVIRKGVELLTGKEGDAALEVGLDQTIPVPSTGYYALVAADRQDLDESNLSVDGDDHRLLLNGETLRAFPWIVFRISKSNSRADFGSIPELKECWQAFLASVRSRKRADAEEKLTAFRVATLTSPDLILADADRLVAKAKEVMERAFSGVMQNRSKALERLPELGELDLYKK